MEKIKILNDVQIKDELLSNGRLLISQLKSKNYIEKCLNLIDNFYLIRQCWSLKESYNNK